ncbi:hypothetical protein PC129_g245 [Phytophthora cactorum]|uniref:Tc1-like transposase DDE domain-containing protein n=1 Tax=Phytophthora cactorum TaxID=29920 RepID=A0A8T1GWX5_9STRA|nr:hypothetical protein PC118_g93 [Phytophthora cactorum]KAG3042576.1 hypothetical protein PC119_g38 [Phytophthora cactorum]KAG3106405.1 hypothetical protein PC122_g408 [Phytophthora cactorum]KAG3229268.1 hypothetical protein PC129_g245 [Phytophthora cactorum]
MPSQLRLKRHTPEERRRVLDAYSSGGDWRAIAHYNGFPRTTAEYLVGHGRVEDLPRGGSRANKVTPEIKEALETWMNECCTFTLRTLQNLVVEDFNVKLSQTTISRHLIDMMYTIKQADHVQQRDEQGEEEGLSPSKGANLQIQCAVPSAFGVVAYRTHRGSTKMQTNADFVEGLYKLIKESDVYKDEYTDKKIVVVFDNAPAHCQTESLVTKRDGLVLLRLGPYNPIENCFSSLKAHIKDYLALMRNEMNNPVLTMNGEPISKTEARMQLLERAAHVCMTKITQRMVQKMELHASKFVSAAVRMEDMVYGA